MGKKKNPRKEYMVKPKSSPSKESKKAKTENKRGKIRK